MNRLLSWLFSYVIALLIIGSLVKLSGLFINACTARPVYVLLSAVLGISELLYLVNENSVVVDGAIYQYAFFWVSRLAILWLINLILLFILEGIYRFLIKLSLAIRRNPKISICVISLLAVGGGIWTMQEKERQIIMDGFNPQKMTAARLDQFKLVLMDQGRLPVPVENFADYDERLLGRWRLDNDEAEIFEFFERNIVKYYTKQSTVPINNYWVISTDLKLHILMNPGDKNEFKLVGSFVDQNKIILYGGGKRVVVNKITL